MKWRRANFEALEGGWNDYHSVPRSGWVSGVWGIHKNDRIGKWVLIHIPSGRSVGAHASTLPPLKALAENLDAAGDWSDSRPLASQGLMGRACAVVQDWRSEQEGRA